MSTTVQIGWLKDKNGDKFAPKTLISQVQTSDGILLEDKLQSDWDEFQNEVFKSIENVSVETDTEFSDVSTNPVANYVLKAKFDDIDEIFNNVDTTFETHEHTMDKVLMADSEGNFFESEADYGEAPAYTLQEAFAWIDRHLVNIYASLDEEGTTENIGDIINEHDSSTTAHNDIRALIDAKVPTSRTVNGKALSSNITLSAADMGAYTTTEIDNYEFITTDAIDTICGTTIQIVNANDSEVTF